MMEEWRICTQAPRYEVSNLGRVRNRETQRIKKLHKDKHGDLAVNLWRYPSGKREGGALRVKVLVMHAFAIKVESKLLIRAINGIREDCRFENLYYATRKSISEECWKLGKMEGTRKKSVFVKGNKFNKWKPGPAHPRWNPSSPHHLRDFKRFSRERLQA